MYNRRESVTKTFAVIAALAAKVRGGAKTTNGDLKGLTIPFEFAAGRGSLLVRARVNGGSTLLMIDTGSSHTILSPSLANTNPKELSKPRTGVGVTGDAISQVVNLELGPRTWPGRRVSVMDLSEALSAYQEKIGGLLGLDFLLEFSQVVIKLKESLVSFIP
jgi:hypothetical protein